MRYLAVLVLLVPVSGCFEITSDAGGRPPGQVSPGPEAGPGASVDACADLATRMTTREHAASQAELTVLLVGRWRMCLHFAGLRPFGVPDFAGLDLAADGRFVLMLTGDAGMPDASHRGVWRTDPFQPGGLSTWTLQFDSGESFQLYAVFSADRDELVSDVLNMGSAETYFVRTTP